MSVVSLSDVKSHLGITSNNDDVKLLLLVNSVTAQADSWFGPVAPRSVTEWRDGGSATITLYKLPVISVETVTEYVLNTPYVLTEQPLTGAVTQWGYTKELSSGQLTRRVNALASPFAVGTRNVCITYTAGRSTVPADIYEAALEDIRGVWQQTQQGGRPDFSGSAQDTGWTMGSAHMFPRLASLAESSRKLPGIA